MNEAAPVTREARRKNRYHDGRAWSGPVSCDDFSPANWSSGTCPVPEYSSPAAAVFTFVLDRLRPGPCATATAFESTVLPEVSDFFSRDQTVTARAMLMRPAIP